MKRKKLSPALRSELNGLVDELIKKCTSSVISNGNESFEEFVSVYNLLNKINSIESGIGERIKIDRSKQWEEFISWSKERGICCENISLCESNETGCGLKATKDIKENDVVLTVPKSAMLTVDHAIKTRLGPLVKNDPILQKMPNVTLSLLLINEISLKTSSWSPYIKMLPYDYSTVLYFTPEDVKKLKGSPMHDEAIKMNKNIARQYAYFYRKVSKEQGFWNTPWIEFFTYNNYRWAVSTVMTRQNLIPSSLGNGMCTALIPMWDMCNHGVDKITTDYDDSKNSCVCYAARDFKCGSEIYICYGKRTNNELFLHNGFVCSDNKENSLSIRLGISKNDSLFDQRCNFLKTLQISPSGNFQLSSRDKEQEKELMSFLHVFLMKKEELEKCLGNPKACISDEKKIQIMMFLKTRSMILLKAYPTSLKEDEEILAENSTKLSTHARISLQHLVSEKKILSSHANS